MVITQHKSFPLKDSRERPVTVRVFYESINSVLRETDQRIDEKINAYRRRVIRYEIYCWIAFVLSVVALVAGFAIATSGSAL